MDQVLKLKGEASAMREAGWEGGIPDALDEAGTEIAKLRKQLRLCWEALAWDTPGTAKWTAALEATKEVQAHPEWLDEA